MNDGSEADDLLHGFPVVWTAPLVWGDMDALGHVNNTAYFRYFESARIELLRAIDFLGPPAGQRAGPILASTECRFRRALQYPDHIRVGTRVTEIGEDRFTSEYRVVSDRLGAVAAEGSGVVVSFDYEAGGKTAIPDLVAERLRTL